MSTVANLLHLATGKGKVVVSDALLLATQFSKPDPFEDIWQFGQWNLHRGEVLDDFQNTGLPTMVE